MAEPENRTGLPGEVWGRPHRRGAAAPADLLTQYADLKACARYHRGRRMNRVRAIRRVQLRDYFKKAA